jgi:Zn-dependent peptidase ImmA (M78 family)/transcriptional regulator with XRE-family HTH domain
MSKRTTKGSFVRERLPEARDARSMTQDQLAKAIGRSNTTVCNWERGEQAPEPAVLDAVAQARGLAPGYFLRPAPAHGSGAIFFRSLESATARVRTRERARLRWLQHISLTLQERLEFPEVDVPACVGPGEYRRLGLADLERIAAELRAHWCLGEGPVPNMVLVAENAGVVVGLDDVGSTKIDGQGNWSEADGRPYMLLAKDKNTAFRRQMDVAHELAHLVLHRGATEEDLVRDFVLIEEQAKYLACALLLPHRPFASELLSLSLDGFLALKPRWRVSIGAMIMRAHQLELLTNEGAKRLWKYRATRGWHRHEPMDSPDENPVEEPRLLRRSIEMIVDERVQSRRELLESDICLGAADVEVLAALPSGYFSKGGAAEVIRLEPRLRRQGEATKGDVVPFRRPG